LLNASNGNWLLLQQHQRFPVKPVLTAKKLQDEEEPGAFNWYFTQYVEKNQTTMIFCLNL